MMLKSKICLTVLVVYEILAVILVHMTRICTAMFGTHFCADGGFKYFIACFAIPALAFLVLMWIGEIIGASERRHSIMHKAKHALTDMMDDVKDKFTDNLSSKDIEKFLAAAAVIGIRRYAQTHPNTRRMFENIMATVRGEETAEYADASEYTEHEESEYEDAEYEDTPHTRNSNRSSSRHGTARNRTTGTKSRIRK